MLNLFISNQIITDDTILKVLKKKWSSNTKKWSEIQNFKSFVDISQSNIKFEIFLKNGESEKLNVKFKELLNDK